MSMGVTSERDMSQGRRIRQLTEVDLQRWLASPMPPVELIVRVVSGTGTHVTVRQLELVDCPSGDLTFRIDQMTDLGPAEQLQSLNPFRWREAYVGCRRVKVAWAAWKVQFKAAAAQK